MKAKFMVALGFLILLALPINAARCNCTYPNKGLYGVQNHIGDIAVCKIENCWIPL